MSEYEYKTLTPAEVIKLRRIFAADPRFRRRKKVTKQEPTKPERAQATADNAKLTK